jgi:hypothetical protein
LIPSQQTPVFRLVELEEREEVELERLEPELREEPLEDLLDERLDDEPMNWQQKSGSFPFTPQKPGSFSTPPKSTQSRWPIHTSPFRQTVELDELTEDDLLVLEVLDERGDEGVENCDVTDWVEAVDDRAEDREELLLDTPQDC